MSTAPIGIFDSGVGGLTVARAIRARLPDEGILYLGDTARLPYGTKSARTVARYTQRNVAFLAERGVKAIVIACNSASATALDELDTHGLPLWGVIEPGARAAARVSRGRVGGIATEATIRAGIYRRALEREAPQLEIHTRACPLFVPLVEEGWEADGIAEAVARRYLTPLLRHDIDTLVLGCTHYPLLSTVIARVVGRDVTLVDSAESVAGEVAAGLAQLGLTADGDGDGHRVLVTDDSPPFARLARRILGEDAHLEAVDLTA
ncbi:MAG: glutamate racemase [Thermoanaerobaculia bacterium]|nr:glutamate racemase [Thermoanaerobaculia bacterium]